MSASEEFVALDKWTLLQRDRVQHAVDMALGMLNDGYYRQVGVILTALSNRLAVDSSVEEFWEQHDQLDGGECHALHQ